MTGAQQTYRAFNSRNRFLSIRNSIVMLLTCSALLRLVLWVKVCVPGDLNDTFMLLMFFLPLWFNFASLSLLAVFYTEAVYGGKTKWPMRIYLIVNLILLVLNVYVATGTAARLESNDDGTHVFSAFSVAYSSFVDFLLAMLLCYYGIQFQAICNENGNALTTWNHSSVTIFESINWMLIIIYIFRGIAAAVISQHPDVMGQVAYDGDHEPTRATVLIFFFITEVLPSLCVMLMLWRLGGSSSPRLKVESMTAADELDGNFQGLNTRLLSVEDSKVRVLVGDESLINENGGGERNLIAGEDTTEFVLFSRGMSQRDNQAARGQGQYLGQDTTSLLHSGQGQGQGQGLERGNVRLPHPSAGTEPIADYNKYSISAESSFLEDNKALFAASSADDAAGIARRTSPLVIADNGSGGNGGALGLAGSNDSSSLRVGVRRGSWNSTRTANQYVSKRTPSPMLPDGQRSSESHRSSDGEEAESPMQGSFPLNQTGLFLLHGGGGSSNNLVGMGRNSSNNLVGLGIARGTSSNNLAAMAAVSEEMPGLGTPASAASASAGAAAAAATPAASASAAKDKYADTVSPMDILRKSQQQQQQGPKKKSGKGK